MSKMGPDRQPTTGTCFALARLTPTCLLPTTVNFKKDPSFHCGWNLTDLLGQLLTFSWGLRQLYPSSPKPKSVGPTKLLFEIVVEYGQEPDLNTEPHKPIRIQSNGVGI